jgi:hypothetical protein
MGEPKGFLVVPIGFNPSDDLRSLELDASDNLKVAFAAAAQGLVGPHGWIGGAWQKNPLPLGHSGPINERLSTVVAGAPITTVLSGAVVPSGEIWWIQAAVMFHTDGGGAFVSDLYAKRGASAATEIDLSPALASFTGLKLSGPGLILQVGDKLQASVYGSANGTLVFLCYWGSRIDVDQ